MGIYPLTQVLAVKCECFQYISVFHRSAIVFIVHQRSLLCRVHYYYSIFVCPSQSHGHIVFKCVKILYTFHPFWATLLCSWHTYQQLSSKPVPENRYRFVTCLICNLVSNFYCRAMLCMWCLSVCLVMFVSCVKTNKRIIKFFSPSSSHADLVFPRQTT